MGELDVSLAVLEIVLGILELRREMLAEEGDVLGARGIDGERRLVNAGIERQLVARVCGGNDRFTIVDLHTAIASHRDFWHDYHTTRRQKSARKHR